MTDTTELAPVTTERAYGEKGLEAAAGYTPLPDESKEEAPAELTKEEAADERRKQNGEQKMVYARVYETGLAPNVTLDLDQAAAMLAESREADKAQAELDGTKAAQKEIDALRGPVAPQVETEADIEKVLANPKIRDAIAERVTAADSQREAYATRVTETGTIAIAALAHDFPELASLPLENWEFALRQMHQREPARFQQAIGRIQTVAKIQQVQNQITAEKTAREAAEFQTYARAEDARFTAMVKGERNMPAIEAEIVAMVKDHGVDPREFFKAGTESKFLRSAAAQKILVDAAKYRMMQKNAKALTHAVPTIQKPGFSGPRVDRAETGLAQLSAKLSKSGSLKDAVALRLARSKRR